MTIQNNNCLEKIYMDNELYKCTKLAPSFDNIASSSIAVQWGGTASFSCLIIGPTSNLKTNTFILVSSFNKLSLHSYANKHAVLHKASVLTQIITLPFYLSNNYYVKIGFTRQQVKNRE